MDTDPVDPTHFLSAEESRTTDNPGPFDSPLKRLARLEEDIYNHCKRPAFFMPLLSEMQADLQASKYEKVLTLLDQLEDLFDIDRSER